MICWICEFHIDGDFSRDHLYPRELGLRDKQDWKPSHILCNHARGNLSVEKVDEVKKTLNRRAGNEWIPLDIRIELAAMRHPSKRLRLRHFYETAALKEMISYAKNS